MQRNELQATGTTSSKVLLDVLAILWGQIRLLKAVDVSGNFIVHRDACFKQNGDFEKHAGLSNRPSFSFAEELAAGVARDVRQSYLSLYSGPAKRLNRES